MNGLFFAIFLLNKDYPFKGGVFKSDELEVTFGAAPLAYIMEQVGGSAILTSGMQIFQSKYIITYILASDSTRIENRFFGT